MNRKSVNQTIYKGETTRTLLFINIAVALIYLLWWFNLSHMSNQLLYYLLFFGEIYHVFMAIAFWMTIMPNYKKANKPLHPQNASLPMVDIFITVAGEPVEIVEQTAHAAKNISYPRKAIYILNDGYVSNKENWEEMKELATRLGINCITRQKGGGAKAGNINHALGQTSGEYIAVFDADMIPKTSFLEKTLPFFSDPSLGFVQTPQYYQNAEKNDITAGAWEQQEFFFGPIMRGKGNSNSAFICGTNFVIRRETILEVGGMREDNIAEDFLTSLSIHQKKWKSLFIDDVLAVGLAPEDLLSYYKQQLRWARGSLEVLFGSNPIFKRGLTWHQKMQYLSSALYYFNGPIVLIDMIMPLLFLFFGTVPVTASTSSFALFFLPFMFLNLYTLYLTSNGNMTFRAISFSQASFTLQLKALFSVLLRRKMSFSVTPKQAQKGNFLFLVYPHLLYIVLALCGFIFALFREGVTPSVITNIAWASLNIVMFLPFISVAYSWKGILSRWQKRKIDSPLLSVAHNEV